jgi:DNA-binding CsgD family transcriptional regulator
MPDASPELRALLERMSRSMRELEHDLERVAAAVGLRPAQPAPRRPRPDFSRLSAREAEVVEHLLSGRRVMHIAAWLALSPNTVRSHLKSVFKKLGVGSQGELVELVRGEGQ